MKELALKGFLKRDKKASMERMDYNYEEDEGQYNQKKDNEETEVKKEKLTDLQKAEQIIKKEAEQEEGYKKLFLTYTKEEFMKKAVEDLAPLIDYPVVMEVALVSKLESGIALGKVSRK